MIADRNSLFGPLEPPSGGVEKMRRRLDAQRGAERRVRRLYRAAAVGAAAAAALAAILIVSWQGREAPRTPEAEIYQAREFDRLLGRKSRPAELSVAVDDTSVAVSEVETPNPKVRLYALERTQR